MQQPGRTFTSGTGYRYGFNGKELDKETSSTSTYDYGFRIYSPALGRFLSVDPLTGQYPELTPYQFASNKPINSIDLDGLESKEVYIWEDNTGKKTRLEVIVSDPYDLGSGTLFHYYKTEEVSSRQTNRSTVETQLKKSDIHWYVAPEKGFFEKIGAWFKSIAPQVQVWGSGTTDFGSKANPDKPLYSVNLNDDEWSVLLGMPNLMKTPDLKGVGWEKFTGLVNKLFNVVKSEENKKWQENTTQTTVENNTKPTPAINSSTPRIEPGNTKPKYIYSGIKRGTVVHRREAGINVKVETDSTGTIEVKKPATDSIPKTRN